MRPRLKAALRAHAAALPKRQWCDPKTAEEGISLGLLRPRKPAGHELTDEGVETACALVVASHPSELVHLLCEELGYGFVLQQAAYWWATKAPADGSPKMGHENMAEWLQGLVDDHRAMAGQEEQEQA